MAQTYSLDAILLEITLPSTPPRQNLVILFPTTYNSNSFDPRGNFRRRTKAVFLNPKNAKCISGKNLSDLLQRLKQSACARNKQTTWLITMRGVWVRQIIIIKILVLDFNSRHTFTNENNPLFLWQKDTHQQGRQECFQY